MGGGGGGGQFKGSVKRGMNICEIRTTQNLRI